MKHFYFAIIIFLILLGLLGDSIMFSDARADRAVKFFEMLKHTKGKFHGQPFNLLPWQTNIIRDVYGTLKEDGTRQYKFAYLEIPKKNGKSEMAAGAALYHLFADGEKNGEVYGCAADRGQASIVFDVAVDMIDQLPALQKRSKILSAKKRILDKVSGSYYQVLSAEAYTKHGLNASAVIFDELHAQPNRDLWDVMTFGAGDARSQPIWWVITTAGDDPDRVSIGWEQHDYAMMLLSGERTDPTWYPVVFGYSGDDIYNEQNWHIANPSLGTTIQIESVRESAVKAKIKPADERLFRWLRLNQWITTKLTTWLPLDLFEKTTGNWNVMDLAGLDCYLGVDLSATTDLSSISLVFPPQGTLLEWRVFWYSWIPRDGMQERVVRDHVPYDQWAKAGWLTVTDGNTIDYSAIEEKIIELSKIYKIIEVDADMKFAMMLLQRLEKVNITCVDIPQSFLNMTSPLDSSEKLIRDMKITHPNDLVAKWTFGNASIAKNGNGNMKLVKEHKGGSVVKTKRIDPIVAWMNAMSRALTYKGSVDLSAQILSDDWGM